MKTSMFLSAMLGLAIGAPALADTTAWDLDTSHTEVGFSVRHLMVSNTKGKFQKFSGALNLDEKDPTKSTVEVSVDVASIDTNDEKRDQHLRSPDFFEAEKFPQITFKSKSIKKAGKGFKAVGDLTIRGITKEVTLDIDGLTATVKDPWGNEHRGLVAKGKINRHDFKVSWNKALDAGGVVVGDEVQLSIEAEFIKRKA
jgi:polyisoprenoid-binding protein YceI